MTKTASLAEHKRVKDFRTSGNEALRLISEAAGDDEPLQMTKEMSEVIYTVAASIGQAIRKLKAD